MFERNIRQKMKYLLIVFLLVLSLQGLSQTKGKTVEAELLIHSRHLWRGMQFGQTATAEPSVTFRNGRFALNLWAAKTLDDSYAEIDLIPSFQLGNYEITVFDYYNPVPGEDNRFFTLKEGRNRHSTELAVTHHAHRKFPVKMMVATFFFGDKNPDTGHPFYSTYAEMSSPLKWAGIQWEPILGLTPHRGYYADGFEVVNTSMLIGKRFRLGGQMSLPVRFSVVHNPFRGKTFVALAAGICWK